MTVDEDMNRYSKAYIKMLPEMLKEHEGKIVVFINETEPFGYFDSDAKAYYAVRKTYGIVPMFIQEVSKEYLKEPHGPVESFTSRVRFLKKI